MQPIRGRSFRTQSFFSFVVIRNDWFDTSHLGFERPLFCAKIGCHIRAMVISDYQIV